MATKFESEGVKKIGMDQPEFNIGDSPGIEINIKDSMVIQASKLAEHEGKISGLAALISALQSYKGFLQGVILSLLAFVLGGFALVVSLQGRTDRNVDGLSAKVTSLEGKVDALPTRPC